jgi:hypothetical protein
MDPSTNDFDDVQSSFPPVQPNTSVPRVIGTLNIIFAICLLLCGACYGLQVLMQSAMAPMMAAQQQQFQAAMAAERQKEIHNLREEEKAAKTDEEKAQIQAQIKAFQAQPLPTMPDMTKLTKDVRVQGYCLADIVTGMVLNVVMLISGIGLVGLKEWGRVTALWVAAIKIVRLVVLYGVFIVVIVPIITKQFIEIFEEMAKAAPPGAGGPGAQEMETAGTFMGYMMTGTGIAIMIVGAIYPAVVLWLLSRPRVKAACTQPRPTDAD